MDQVSTIDIGDEAPDFELKDQHGAPVRLSKFRGSNNVLLVFYPFAFTGVCTGELHAIRDRLAELRTHDAEVVVVSTDTVPSQRVFAEREGFEFPLLSDFWPHGATASAYGVLDAERGCALRGSFVIDKEGVIRWCVVNALPDARNIEDYAQALASLG
jgi:peroxiredoxin